MLIGAVIAVAVLIVGSGTIAAPPTTEHAASATSAGDPWVKMGWNNGPIPIDSMSWQKLSGLTLPAGRYLVTAKLHVRRLPRPWGGEYKPQSAECRLMIGNSWDVAETTLSAAHSFAALTMTAASALADIGTANLSCRLSGHVILSGPLDAGWIKITALEVGTLRVVEME
jgi:hypothetical protein